MDEIDNKIPKIIHYCWFGNNKMSKLAKKCMKSWKKYCPDYKIIRWDEKSFNLKCNQFAKEAYESKKWAFVTDVVRLYAIKKFGGIYMDTDVELLKPLDKFLIHDAFSGFESAPGKAFYPITGIIGCKKGNKFISEMYSYYDKKHFILDDGSYNTTPNTIIFAEKCKKLNFVLNDKKQELNGYCVYPHDYFCPKEAIWEEPKITDKTYCIHHFSGSWLDNDVKKLKKWKKLETKLYDNNLNKLISPLKLLYYGNYKEFARKCKHKLFR